LKHFLQRNDEYSNSKDEKAAPTDVPGFYLFVNPMFLVYRIPLKPAGFVCTGEALREHIGVFKAGLPGKIQQCIG